MRRAVTGVMLCSLASVSCAKASSHRLSSTSRGVCVLSAPKDSDLMPGDLIIGPGDLTVQPTRGALFMDLIERSNEPLSVVVWRNEQDLTLSATRRRAHHPDGMALSKNRCETASRNLGHAEAAAARAAADAAVIDDATSVHSSARAEHAFIEQDDGPRLFARRVGHSADDPVVIVVNGGPGKSHDHLRTLEVLADRGWTVVTYDQRGTGHSDEPFPHRTRDYALPKHADDLEAVRQWTGAERIVLLGHSWGGPLILQYASQYPDHVSGLLTVGSGAVADADYADVDHQSAPADAPPPPDGLDPSCASWWPAMLHYYPDPADFEPEHLAGTCHDDISRLVWRATDDYNLAPGLTDFTGPTLVWYGGYDPLTVLRPKLLAALPQADVTDVLIEDCGHRPMFQCPDVFYRDIEPWMNGVVGR